ncbi:MAG: DUF2868 domain-containing protein [Candidatus Electrothrix sp. YB6]
MKKKQWNLTDLIDLEFFLQQDEGEEIDTLAARDREIYTNLPAAVQTAEPVVLLRAWLAARRGRLSRAGEGGAPPGGIWQELLCFFFAASLLAGLFSGGGLAFSFLTYSGRDPVNVAAYFSVFVLLQAGLFLLLAGSAFLHKLQGSSVAESSLLYRLLRRIFTGLLEKLVTGVRKKATSRISAEKRLKWSAYSTSIRQLPQRYGLVFFRPFFLVTQAFGASFNLGVLAATLFKVIGADLAFGWQTTLQVTPASVHRLVHWISLPWSWLPDPFIPSLSQIEGSRLVLKDGIYALSNHDLTSWWPFLCLSVLCYGLLPRLALLLIVAVQQHRDLARLDFQQGRFRQTVHRMRTPLVSTAARYIQEPARAGGTEPAALAVRPKKNEPAGEGEPALSAPEKETGRETDSGAAPPITALIPDEILPDIPQPALQEQVRRRLGYDLCRLVPFWTLNRNEEEELAVLQAAMQEHGCDDLFLLQEAWQPPIEELFTWLGLLRRTVGQRPIIFLALVGKPTPETILTPVQLQHLQIWQQKTAALGDPGLQLIELVTL